MRLQKIAKSRHSAFGLTLEGSIPDPMKNRESGFNAQAGLLTCSDKLADVWTHADNGAEVHLCPEVRRRQAFPSQESGLTASPKYAAYSCGTVADLHGIPYSPRVERQIPFNDPGGTPVL